MGISSGPSTGTSVATKDRTETKRPSLYKVILLNDDYTPMDFVVMVLKKIFQHQDDSAQSVMLQVHHDGYGVAGVYQFDIAETKVQQVHALARQNEHPLRCTLEKE